MPTARYGCVAAAMGGRLYVVGGHDGRRVLSSADRFDPATEKWEALPPMPTARSRCAAATLRGRLYVVGGRDGRAAAGTPAAECFEPAEGGWKSLPPMPLVPLWCAAAAMGGSLYVVGSDSERHMRVEWFDPASLRWSAIEASTSPYRRHRFGCAAAVVAGAMHVVGGHDGTHPVAAAERFRPCRDRVGSRSGRWEPLPDSPTARHGCAAVAAGGVLYLLGGEGRASGSLTAVERFDPTTGRWEPLKPALTGRFGCAAAAVWR